MHPYKIGGGGGLPQGLKAPAVPERPAPPERFFDDAPSLHRQAGLAGNIRQSAVRMRRPCEMKRRPARNGRDQFARGMGSAGSMRGETGRHDQNLTLPL